MVGSYFRFRISCKSLFAWTFALNKHAMVLTLKVPVSNTSVFIIHAPQIFFMKYWNTEIIGTIARHNPMFLRTIVRFLIRVSKPLWVITATKHPFFTRITSKKEPQIFSRGCSRWFMVLLLNLIFLIILGKSHRYFRCPNQVRIIPDYCIMENNLRFYHAWHKHPLVPKT